MAFPHFLSFATAIVAVGLVFGSTGCGSGGGSSPSPAPSVSVDVPVTTRSTYGPLEFTLTTPKAVYKQGEAINMAFTVKNTSSGPVSVDYFEETFDGRPVYESVTQNTQLVYRNKGGILGGFSPVELASGETQTFPVRWDQTIYNSGQEGNGQAGSGTYAITVRYDAFRVWPGSIASRQGVVLPNGLTSDQIDQSLGPAPISIFVK